MYATEEATRIQRAIARYRVQEGVRLLVAVGRRDSAGRVAIDQLVDRPASGSGRSYLVESDLRAGDRLRAYVAEYTRQAEDLGLCPMSGEAITAVLARGARAKEALS